MKKILELRKKAGLTQEQLSKLAGVHRTVIARVEEGVNKPSLKTMLRLSKALKVRVDDLID